MPTQFHEELITGAEIALGGRWERHGFAQAVSLAMMEERLGDEGSDDFITANNMRGVIPDAFQIDAQARKVRLIEVGEIKDFGSRTSVADQLDFYSWDMDVYWIEPKSGTIFLIDGSSLASVQFFLDHCEKMTAKTALAHLRQNANIVGRAIPTKTVRPRKEIKKFGKSVAHKRQMFLRKHVYSYCKEDRNLAIAA